MYRSMSVISLGVGWLWTGLMMIWTASGIAQENSVIPDKPSIEVIIGDDDNVTGLANLLQQGYDVKLYDLDVPKKLFAALSRNLPADQAAAKRTLERRMQQYGRQTLQQQLMDAYQGLSVAIQYRIDRYPAVLFDRGRAVIYGVTDLQQALSLYRQWQMGLTR
jgi:integrating conjugative element protein (TIGR03757 family)